MTRRNEVLVGCETSRKMAQPVIPDAPNTNATRSRGLSTADMTKQERIVMVMTKGNN